MDGGQDRAARTRAAGPRRARAARAARCAWRPGFLGYPDSGNYLLVTVIGPLFAESLRTAGYPLFLRGVHIFDTRITTVDRPPAPARGRLRPPVYATVVRAVRSRWAALLPAAVVLFGGTELFLEHAILSEAVYIFLEVLSAYAVVRSVDSSSPAWPVAAGLGRGLAAVMRTIGIAVVPLVVLAVLAIRRPSWRRRAALTAAVVVAAAVPLLAYSDAQYNGARYFGLTRGGNWNLYARVAPFADCSKFTPPSGTRALCDRTPISKRPGGVHLRSLLAGDDRVRRPWRRQRGREREARRVRAGGDPPSAAGLPERGRQGPRPLRRTRQQQRPGPGARPRAWSTRTSRPRPTATSSATGAPATATRSGRR